MEYLPLCILAMQSDADRAFMEKLYAEHQRLMYLQARAVLRNPPDIEDALGQALLALIEKVALLKDMAPPVLRAYVLATVRNTSLNYARRENRRRGHGLDMDAELLAQIPDVSQDVEARLLRDESVRRMEAAIEALGETEAAILREKYYLDMDIREIAARRGLKPETVRKALYRSRKRLMALYAEEE